MHLCTTPAAPAAWHKKTKLLSLISKAPGNWLQTLSPALHLSHVPIPTPALNPRWSQNTQWAWSPCPLILPCRSPPLPSILHAVLCSCVWILFWMGWVTFSLVPPAPLSGFPGRYLPSQTPEDIGRPDDGCEPKRGSGATWHLRNECGESGNSVQMTAGDYLQSNI